MAQRKVAKSSAQILARGVRSVFMRYVLMGVSCFLNSKLSAKFRLVHGGEAQKRAGETSRLTGQWSEPRMLG